MEQSNVKLTVPATVNMTSLLGVGDEILREIESRYHATITVRGDQIIVSGDAIEVQALSSLCADLLQMAERDELITREYVSRTIDHLQVGDHLSADLRDDILLTYRGRAIRPRTSGQKSYIEAIRKNTITFGIGPAGTGKTYLAMAMAVAALKRKTVGRIVLTRPVVEAGESLGFLPGTLQEKVDPYIRPLYDALFDMTDMEKGNALIEQGVIEIAPLAFMRGRTLNDAFVILDEAQNTTPEQMKMFLTRLGFGSKIVITGDRTQTDLSGRSGLERIRAVLDGIEDIAFVNL